MAQNIRIRESGNVGVHGLDELAARLGVEPYEVTVDSGTAMTMVAVSGKRYEWTALMMAALDALLPSSVRPGVKTLEEMRSEIVAWIARYRTELRRIDGTEGWGTALIEIEDILFGPRS